MTRQQQGLLLALLLVVMVAVYARPLLHHRAPAPAPAQAADAGTHPAGHPAVPPLDAPASPQRGVQRQRAADLRWSRDPFIRGGASGQMSGLSLSGILWSVKAPMAIINGQMAHVGDELEGYRVLEIRQDRVAVSDGTETLQLTITP